MSLLSSFIIDPVVRQARRLSGVSVPAEASNDEEQPPPLSHANSTTSPNTSSLHEVSAHAPTTRDAIPMSAPEQRPDVLNDQSRRYPSFSRQAQDAVMEEDDNGQSRPTIAAPIAIPATTATNTPQNTSRLIAYPATARMARQTSRLPDDELRQPVLDPSLSSAPAAPSLLHSRSSALAQNASPLSESLPADDGMAYLRARIHDIRDLNITDQERARMVHSLMTERYNLRSTSPSSFVSHDRPFTPNSSLSVFSEAQASSPLSAASDLDPENPFNLRPGDTSPSYRPRPTGENQVAGEEEAAEAEPELGCEHYKRNVKVQCYDCRRWYTCRHCHNAVQDHELNRRRTQHMLCMVCRTPQKAAERCSNCLTEGGCYYCDICKLWDNNSAKPIYHCQDCGICRRGEGLGKDFMHCKVWFTRYLHNTSNCSSFAMFACQFPSSKATSATLGPSTVIVRFAATECTALCILWFQCPVDITYTRSVIPPTCKPPTSALSAKRALSTWI